MIKYQEIRLAAVGRYLRKLREDRGLTQWALARSCGFSTAQFVSNWERGEALPALDKFAPLADALGITRRQLVEVVFGCREQELARAKKEALRAVAGRLA